MTNGKFLNVSFYSNDYSSRGSLESEIFLRLRPSSDVVLLPCRTKLQFGSTVARREINSDSDVVPESSQIQALLNNSPPNSPRERNLARTY